MLFQVLHRVFLFLAFFFCLENAYSLPYTSWGYQKKIRINTSLSGAATNSEQYNFPVLVRLNATNFEFSQANTRGEDLRFSSSAGQELPYEIESFDLPNKSAHIWVKVDTIKANTRSHYFNMHWGNPQATDSSTPASVFSDQNKFSAVWHLSDSSSSPEVKDALGKHYAQARTLTSEYSQKGIIGKSFRFNGAEAITVPHSSQLGLGSSTFTFSAWIQPGGAGQIICKRSAETGFELQMTEQNFLQVYLQAGGQTQLLVSDRSLNLGSWYYILVRKSIETLELYINGFSEQSLVFGPVQNSDNNASLTLGQDNFSQNEFFKGVLDEVRLASTARSPDWIRLEYANQREVGSLLELENSYQWTYSKKLVLNTSSGGVALSNPVYAFPLLVRLQGGQFQFNQALIDGSDIRFSSATGAPLAYEIEKWDAAGQQASIWVQVDTLLPGLANQSIYMHWGNRQAISRSDPHQVFPEHQRFTGVWHFSKGGEDASAYGVGAINKNTLAIPGISGDGRIFDGAGDYFSVPVFYEPRSRVYVSAWVWAESRPSWASILKNWAHNFGVFHFGLNTQGQLNLQIAEANYNSIEITEPELFPVKSWQHVVFSLDGQQMRIFRNGVQVTAPQFYNGTLYNTNIPGLAIGYKMSDNSLDPNPVTSTVGYWHGKMDEVQISTEPRSADWIWLSYQNQKENSVFPQISADYQIISKPIYIGYDSSGFIPVSRIAQGDSGKGVLEIPFKILDPNRSLLTLTNLQYQIAGGEWKSVTAQNYTTDGKSGLIYLSSDTNWTRAPVHLLRVFTQNPEFPQLYQNNQDALKFRISVKSFSDSIYTALTEKIVLINKGPAIAIKPTRSRETRPGIYFESTDHIRQAEILVGGKKYPASKSLVGWGLPQNSIDSLGEGYHPLYIAAYDVYGNFSERTFDSILYVDSKKPLVVSVNPKSDTSLFPQLKILFNETVIPGAGGVRLIDSALGSGFTFLPARFTGWGTRELTLKVDSSLQWGRVYYIDLESDFTRDSLGNPLDERIGRQFWNLRIQEEPLVYLDSIQINPRKTAYMRGDTLSFTLYFGGPVSLEGGKLLLTTKIKGSEGGKQIADPILPFTSLTSLTTRYVIKSGDFTDSLQIDQVKIEQGAQLLTSTGSSPILDQYNQFPLASVDGQPPEISISYPLKQTSIPLPEVNYTISENISKGVIGWKAQGGKKPPDSLVWVQDSLTAVRKYKGSYSGVAPSVKLNPGTIYQLTLKVEDAAGNTSEILVDQIRLFGNPEGALLLPKNVQVNLDSILTLDFRVFEIDLAADTNWLSLQNPVFTLSPGLTLQDKGNVKINYFGKHKIVACAGEICDSTEISVYEKKVKTKSTLSDTIQIGTSIQMVYQGQPADISPELVLAQSENLAPGFDYLPFGIKVQSGYLKGQINIQVVVDSSTLGTVPVAGLRFYVIDSSGGMRLIPSKRTQQGKSIIFSTQLSELSSWVLAHDIQEPQLDTLTKTMIKNQGDTVFVPLGVTDNTTHPNIYIHHGPGGGQIYTDTLPASTTKFVINPAQVTEKGYWMTLEADDGVHYVKGDTLELLVNLVESPKLPWALEPRLYKFFSVPGKPFGGSMQSWLHDSLGRPGKSTWKTFDYNFSSEGRFTEVPYAQPFIPGLGYWLQHRHPVPLSLALDSVQTHPLRKPLEITLRPGWNALGNPYFFPLSLEKVRQVNVVAGYIQSNDSKQESLFENFWTQERESGMWKPLSLLGLKQDSLYSWEGYLVWNAGGNQKLIISAAPGLYGPSLVKKDALTGGSLLLSFSEGPKRVGYIDLGYNFSTPSFTQLLPAKDENIGFWVLGPGGEKAQSHRQGLHASGWIWPLQYVATSANKALIEVKQVGAEDPQKAIYVLHPQDGLKKINQTYAAPAHPTQGETFYLIYGTQRYADSISLHYLTQMYILGIALKGGRLQRGTRFTLSLPPGKEWPDLIPVTLSLYDLKGRKLANLVSTSLPPGRHEYIWGQHDGFSPDALKIMNSLNGMTILQLKVGKNKVLHKKVWISSKK